MKKNALPLLALAAGTIIACGGTVAVLASQPTDASTGPDGSNAGDAAGGGNGDSASGHADAGPSECLAPDADGVTLLLGDAGRPTWMTGGCPEAGAVPACPPGTACVTYSGPLSSPGGCAPIPAECTGTPTCACMGSCVCGGNPSPFCTDTGGGIQCNNGLVSRRAYKDDIRYVDDEERQALADQALRMRLAEYRYKNEPQDARRRLGFLIDDQPSPSPAVEADRTHVDQYGYTSMLLATVQQQAKELDALRRRVDELERHHR